MPNSLQSHNTRAPEGEMLKRFFDLPASSLDKEARTVSLVWSTGEMGDRGGWLESLSMENTDIDLGRANNGAPLLFAHETRKMNCLIGTIEKAWVDGGTGEGLVRFGKDADGQAAMDKVEDKVLRKVSVGYSVQEWVRMPEENGVEHFRAKKWTVLEFSLVTVAFEDGAQIRSKPVVGGESNKPSVSNPAARSFQGDEEMFEDILKRALAGEALTADDAKKLKDAGYTERGEKIQAATPEPITRNHEPQPPVDTAAIAAQSATRCADIQEACDAAGLSHRSAEFMRGSKTLDEVKTHIADIQGEVKRAQGITDIQGQIVVGGRTDAAERREAIKRGILSKADRKYLGTDKHKDEAERFQRMPFMEIIRRELESAGTSRREIDMMDKTQLMQSYNRANSVSTSDLSNILLDAMNVASKDGYNEQQATYTPFVEETTTSDFRDIHIPRISNPPDFSEIQQNGEIRFESMSDISEKYAVQAVAVGLNVSWEVLVNDQMGRFMKNVIKFGQSYARGVSAGVYAKLLANPIMAQDSASLFSIAHGNYSAGGATLGKLNDANVQTGYVGMADQRGLQGEHISVFPKHLLVGPANRSIAKKMLASNIVPTNSTDGAGWADDLQLTIDPRISGTGWYLFADKMDMPTLELAYLEGYRGPRIVQGDILNGLGISFKASGAWGVGAVEYRGAYFNEGL